ncbi:hypothetical protein IFR05_012943 [Cadophora sp. M221]|nr:hypothetical protein IFR05_012943 [Cadophora sp. M221]
MADEKAQYITLSHCWGNNSATTTTTGKTIAQHYRSISLAKLPKTFREAVEIIRALGFRYLWIDSLCIIQDDKKDWEIESAKMAGIYRESILTIAATASADSNGGFFFNRWSPSDKGYKVDLETFELHGTFAGTDITVYVRPRLDHGHDVFSGHFATKEYAPLLSRAWVYQERMLAPRTLHVHVEEMFWECKACTMCECGHLFWRQQRSTRDQVDPAGQSYVPNTFTLKSNIARAIDLPMAAEVVHRLWAAAVGEYSALALTKESDRFPALSGLAGLFSQKLQTQYLAGLWGNDLVSGLLWFYEHDFIATRRYRDKSSNFPSWSWASLIRNQLDKENESNVNNLRYDINMENVTVDTRLKILQASCEVIGFNPFGEVSGGTIIIEGALIIAKLEVSEEFPLLKPLLTFQAESSTLMLDVCGTEEHREVSNGEMASCLLLAASKYGARALVLKSVGSDNTYRRVGLLRLEEHQGWFDGILPTAIHII